MPPPAHLLPAGTFSMLFRTFSSTILPNFKTTRFFFLFAIFEPSLTGLLIEKLEFKSSVCDNMRQNLGRKAVVSTLHVVKRTRESVCVKSTEINRKISARAWHSSRKFVVNCHQGVEILLYKV